MFEGAVWPKLRINERLFWRFRRGIHSFAFRQGQAVKGVLRKLYLPSVLKQPGLNLELGSGSEKRGLNGELSTAGVFEKT